VKLLFEQAELWCEQHESPILIPLTSWLESPEKLLISRIEHTSGVYKIAVTSLNQHVFISNSSMEICMYHIPSKKLVRKFCGHIDMINSLQISSNNKFLISCSSDKNVRLWLLNTPETNSVL
jgi:WD40 repeat protein